MTSCDVISRRVESFSKDNAIANKLAGDLDAKLTTSSKQVLLQRIEFKQASKPDEQYEKLKQKYKPLNSGSSFSKISSNLVTNGKTEEDIPAPKRVLYPCEKVNTQWNRVRRMGPGLSNLGNTCFLNSVVQVLTYTAPLVNYLSTQEHSKECRVVGFCMMCELQRHILRSFNHQQNESIKPLSIIQRLRSIAKHLRFGHQEDAHEFLRYVIDGMQKSCLAGLPEKMDRFSKETSLVHGIFGGYYRSQVQCLKCNNTSNTFDPLMEVILEIKHSPSVLRALQRSCKPELLNGDNLYQCPRCKKKVPANKQVLIHREPNILTIQLKRFDYNHIFGGKVSKEVTYTEYLDLRPFMTNPKGPPLKYKLYGVLVHSGYSCNSGHYYCYARGSNDCWYNMNDSIVRQVGLNTALSQQAYLLFYSRVGTPHSHMQDKKPFSPIATKSPSSVPSPVFPKVIRENDVGTPVSRTGAKAKPTTIPQTPTSTKSTPSASNGHATPTHLTPSTQRPKLTFSFKTKAPGIADGQEKPKEPTPGAAEAPKKEEVMEKAKKILSPSVPEKHIPEKQEGVSKKENQEEVKIGPKKEQEKRETLPSPVKEKITLPVAKDDKIRSPLRTPEPVKVSIPAAREDKEASPPKKVRPPPLFIPRSVQSKGSKGATDDKIAQLEERMINKEILTSPMKATTPWKITPKFPHTEAPFGPMSPPPHGAIAPQQSPQSDVSTASSIVGKTGEWAVIDKLTPSPGPRLPERQHAGWYVSKRTGSEKDAEKAGEEEEEWTEAEGETGERKSKKDKKKKKKRKKKYEEITSPGSDQKTEKKKAKEESESDGNDSSNKENKKRNKKKKKEKERRRKSDERKLVEEKSDDSQEEQGPAVKDKKRKRKHVDEVETKKQRLVDYSSNEESESGSNHGDTADHRSRSSRESSSSREEGKKGNRAPPVVICDGDQQSTKQRRSTWDGSRGSSVVSHLLKNGGGLSGYGNSVTSWEGDKSVVDSFADNGDRRRRTRRDSWDEDLDRGKVKKVRDKSKHERSVSGRGNLFQREQDKRGRKGVVDRVTSHFSRRSSTHSRSHSSRGYRRF